uniref:phage tail protein n=1 Tax=Enterobacter asburiae TaxID=61645 RepID=UPI00293467B3
MANLPETPQWEDGIYQIEVSDPVLGGPDGISNRQAKQLASRTSYLKQKVEKSGTDLAAHIAAADPHTQYAPKASPTFTGTPTAPTPANSDNSKKLATTEFVAKALAALAGSAPETLDTLKELADALGNDPNFATTVLNKLAEKLAKDQNGADIPDPALFVKNLGLGEGSALPVGVPIPWPSATPPTGWLKCNGAAFTASQYP